MISAIPHPAQPGDASQPTTVRQPSPQATPQPSPTDTVQLSGAALAARAIIQEATENRVQTAREAATGDVQAKEPISKRIRC
jgi:hypothetical protein